jgi:UDP-3-O-[3-hydroxymyristoyl] N-acetylglucosamine deacetylase
MSPLNVPNPDKQLTIGKSFSLSGIGIHSGKICEIVFSPAPADEGVYFVYGGKKVPARADLVSDTSRGTSIDGIQVVEHALAAINGLGIDNIKIEVFSAELPVLDGSALPYLKALKSAGIVELGKKKKYLIVDSPIEVNDGSGSLKIAPFNGFKINFMIEFPYIGRQEFCYSEGFEDQIAPARTFGLFDELEQLNRRGLARGASLDNALAIGKSGYLNPPRFKNEPVRHKILDLIGDLALVGRQVKGEIIAKKSGHKLNIELSRRLLALC